MAKKFIVIDTHADEYSASELTGTMTVGKLIEYLQNFSKDTPIIAGNNRQSRNDWYTFSEIVEDRICEYEEDEYDEEDDD